MIHELEIESGKGAALELALKVNECIRALNNLELGTPPNKQNVEMPCPSKLFPEWKMMNSDWKRGAHAMYRALASHFTH